MLEAIREHRQRGGKAGPRPLARQRSRVRSGGRAWERAASGMTKTSSRVATDGGDDEPVKIRASPRIAVPGAAKTKTANSGGGGGGRRTTPEIPRMPSFGGAWARRGRMMGGIAGKNARKGSKLSNAVDLGAAGGAPTDETKEPSTPAGMSPHASTWRGFVKTAGASIFNSGADSGSVIHSDQRTDSRPLERADSPTPVYLPVAPHLGPEASGIKQPEGRAGENAVDASEMIAVSARVFMNTNNMPETTRPPPAGGPRPVPATLGADGQGGRGRAKTEEEEEAEAEAAREKRARAIAAELSAAAAAVVAGRRRPPSAEREAGPEEELLASAARGPAHAPGWRDGGSVTATTTTTAERAGVQMVGAGGKTPLAPSDDSANSTGISVNWIAKRFEQQRQQQQQQQQQRQTVDGGGGAGSGSDSEPLNPCDATPDVSVDEDDDDSNTKAGDFPPAHADDESTEDGSVYAAGNPLYAGGRVSGHGRGASGDTDGKGGWDSDDPSTGVAGDVSPTSITSLVRDALQLADAIEKGWSGVDGEDSELRSRQLRQSQQQQQQRRLRRPVSLSVFSTWAGRPSKYDSAASAAGMAGAELGEQQPQEQHGGGEATAAAAAATVEPSVPASRAVVPSPPPPQVSLSGGAKYGTSRNEEGVTERDVTPLRPRSLPAPRLSMMVNSPTFESQRRGVGIMANSPTFEPFGHGSARVTTPRQFGRSGGEGSAASPAVEMMANTPHLPDFASASAATYGGHSSLRPRGAERARKGDPLQPPRQPEPSRRFYSTPVGGRDMASMMSNTPTSDVGKSRQQLTSLLSPSTSASPAPRFQAGEAPSAAAAAAAALTAAVHVTRPFAATRAPTAAQPGFVADNRGGLPSDKAQASPADSGMSASAAAAATAAAETAAALESGARAAMARGAAFDSGAALAAMVGGDGDGAKGSGGGGGGEDGGDDLLAARAEETAAGDWKTQQGLDRPKDQRPEASAVLGSDGGGNFPMRRDDDLATEGWEGADDANTPTTRLASGKKSCFESSRQWSTGSFGSFDSNNVNRAEVVGTEHGGGGGSVATSPRSRLREAALGAATLQGMAGAGGRSIGVRGTPLAVARRVPLRCAASGVDLAARIHDFLASERKVCVCVCVCVCVFVCVFLISINRANRLTNENAPVVSGSGVRVCVGTMQPNKKIYVVACWKTLYSGSIIVCCCAGLASKVSISCRGVAE